jgi:DNA-binding Lrp family transcriptional regulator
MLAYIIAQTEPAAFNDVADVAENLKDVLKSDCVLGPADLIIKVNTKDYRSLCDEVVTRISSEVEGIIRTITYTAMEPEEPETKVEMKKCDAYVFVNTLPKIRPDIFANIKKVKGVVNSHLLLGEYDIVVEVEAKTLAILKDIIREIQQIGGVLGTSTFKIV